MHSAINSIWNGEDGEEVFAMYWDSYAGKELQYSRFKYDQLREMGLKFCANFARKYADKYKLEKAEVRLHGEYNGVTLNGQFDFYGTLDGKLSLLDLKTAAYAYPVEKKYVALQLNLYAYLAIQNGYEPPEQLGYIVLNKGGGSIQAPLIWEFNKFKCEEFVANMAEHCRLFDTLTSFPKNPNAMRHNYPCYETKESK